MKKFKTNSNIIFVAPPLILSNLNDTEVTEGCSLELITRTSHCFPIPIAEWFKEDTNVANDDHYCMESNNSEYKLIVNNATEADQGRYIFKSTNDLGSCETSCEALVFG